MECINCKYPDSKVVKSWVNSHDVKLRRRQCVNCGARFTTQENLRPIKNKNSDSVYLAKTNKFLVR